MGSDEPPAEVGEIRPVSALRPKLEGDRERRECQHDERDESFHGRDGNA